MVPRCLVPAILGGAYRHKKQLSSLFFSPHPCELTRVDLEKAHHKPGGSSPAPGWVPPFCTVLIPPQSSLPPLPLPPLPGFHSSAGHRADPQRLLALGSQLKSDLESAGKSKGPCASQPYPARAAPGLNGTTGLSHAVQAPGSVLSPRHVCCPVPVVSLLQNGCCSSSSSPLSRQEGRKGASPFFLEGSPPWRSCPTTSPARTRSHGQP